MVSKVYQSVVLFCFRENVGFAFHKSQLNIAVYRS